LITGLMLLLSAVARVQAQDAPQVLRATIDVTKTGERIEPLMWGHFIENLGNWWEGNAWAELIGDRKFYYRIDNDTIQDPPNRRRWVNQWTPVGPQSSVVMDSARPYVGRHSPRILLAGADPRGIRQVGLPVHQGQTYVGRIVLSGDPSARVAITLAWGPGPNDRQVVRIHENLSQQFRTLPLNFTARADNPRATFEITGTGNGSFRVGAVSLMQADNVDGWRPGYIKLFREMHISTTRWAGNFSANYEWRDGIGNPDRRPPRYDYAWHGLEPNDVGTFEILDLNRLIGSVPYIGVNAALGDEYSAAQWVEYVNGSVNTPMGKLRAQHGHPEPFRVKWWGVGNEMYGEWQIGHMSIDHFVIKYNQFAEAMRAVDPSIILVAPGADIYQMQADSRDRPRVLSPPYKYDGPFDWSGNLLKYAWRNIDYISEHIYGPYGPNAAYYDSASGKWVRDTAAPIQDRLRRIPTRAHAAAEEWQGYLQRMPWLKNTGMRVVMDEWSTGGGGDLAAGLTVAMTLNEMFRHTDVYKRSDHTCAPCAIDYNRWDSPVLRSNGLVFKMLADRFGTVPILDIGGNSPQPQLHGTVGIDIPHTPSGSPTYPLDVMAALSNDRQRLTISVVNPSASAQQLQLEVSGATLPNVGRTWTVSGPSIQARNLAGKPPEVTLTELTLSNANRPITVAPFSINLYDFQLR
jgi:alpha-N-arabinofuranosidase